MTGLDYIDAPSGGRAVQSGLWSGDCGYGSSERGSCLRVERELLVGGSACVG